MEVFFEKDAFKLNAQSPDIYLSEIDPGKMVFCFSLAILPIQPLAADLITMLWSSVRPLIANDSFLVQMHEDTVPGRIGNVSPSTLLWNIFNAGWQLGGFQVDLVQNAGVSEKNFLI